MKSDLETIAEAWPFAQRPLKRVVVKVGSNVLAQPKGGLVEERVEEIARSLANARKAGIETILVSSGAVAAGRGILGMTTRPTSIPELQAVAAIGQGALMETYSRYLRTHGYFAAQMLLNRDDMDDRRRYLNARHALQSLLQYPVIPIINENDTVNIDELKFGDNDMLSAMVAAKLDADLLVIMSNIPGLMTGHPVLDPTARLVPVVQSVGDEQMALVQGDKSSLGTGGMMTKLQAARHATDYGACCVMCNGMKPGMLDAVLAGRFEGTLFLSRGARRGGDARRHWLETSRPRGEITIDAGAVAALCEGHKSLLPVGIRAVSGDFDAGDMVAVLEPGGRTIAKGVSNYAAGDMARIAGRRRDDILAIVGPAAYEEAVHKNNMVIL